MRRRVLIDASLHCERVSLRTRPDKSAATKTPVPAAESQLTLKRAASGMASGATTGGVRCTWLWSAGMSQTGKERLPERFEPRSVDLIGTPEKRPFSVVLLDGRPQSAQHKIRIVQGSHA